MAELITAVSQLLWPLMILAAVLVFRGSIRRVLRTAERRELEFDVGGQRLTMRELSDQQNELIQDLQRQVSTLRKQLDGSSQPGSVPPVGSETPPESRGETVTFPPPERPAESGTGAEGEEPTRSESEQGARPRPAPVAPQGLTGEPFAVLWVDDHPSGNALITEQLRSNGVRVTTVLDTATALGELDQGQYRLIVTDMARQEDGQFRPDAGLALLQELRDTGIDIPVVVYCKQRGVHQHGARARELGAVAVTTSAVEMLANFQSFGLLPDFQ